MLLEGAGFMGNSTEKRSDFCQDYAQGGPPWLRSDFNEMQDHMNFTEITLNQDINK